MNTSLVNNVLRREKFQCSLNPLILYHCRTFLFILKFPLNCTKCMSLHGWFRPTQLSPAPILSQRPECCFWGTLWQISSVFQSRLLPLVADHPLYMDEWDKFSLCLSNHTDSVGEVPNPIYKPLPEQHDRISAFSPPASLSLDVSYGKYLNTLGMCFLCYLQVKI